ncbi:hypothetical protein [Psychroflexus sp. MES1-P1E]|uniref:hypothetical protein n=1 Tax=Psychroflexus sp. MES1-P1E TaxID=2058320 RepID=UPI0011AE312A|nr:hypothetical protein [Psychroflexus sp. MES1-P1E]
MNKLKVMIKKIDLQNLKTQIGTSILIGLIFGILSYTTSYTNTKGNKISSKFYLLIVEDSSGATVLLERHYNYDVAAIVSIGVMSLFLIFKPKTK